MTRITRQLLALPRLLKRIVVMFVDALLSVGTVWLAFCLRLDHWVSFSGGVQIAAAAAIVIALPLFQISGLYRSVHRFAGWHSVVKLARAVAMFGVLYAMIFTIMGIPGVPRTVGLIQPMLFILALGASRTLAGYWLGDARRFTRSKTPRSNVLIYGAGAAGQQLASALSRSTELRVVGFVDDHPGLQGGEVNSARVYRPDQLGNLVDRMQVSEILLAFPSAPRSQRNKVIRSLIGLDVRVRTLPGMMDIAHGRVQVADLKPLEIDDLLGRDVVSPNVLLLSRNVTDRVVLVTGAGGSIGSELCRQILEIGPATLLLVESSEYALYAIHQELSGRLALDGREHVSAIPLLASVCDEARMRQIISAWRPHTIYHAAAYKHVPLVEHNPLEGVRNNVMGTLNTARIAAEFGASHFVLISTDKAVRPTNVMGASKRLAEMALQSLADRSDSTRFSMVRFGNVLNSSGSVVPLFRKQIASGGPITLTHPAITRYFMTISEAAQLVIQAGAMAKGGEVFVLDMGAPVQIIDLARSMIELSGMSVRDEENPDGDIEIKIVGLRPGEKLYEELLIGDNPEPTSHARIMKANERFLKWPEFSRWLHELTAALDESNVLAAQAVLCALVPEYSARREVVDWVALRRSASDQAQGARTSRQQSAVGE